MTETSWEDDDFEPNLPLAPAVNKWSDEQTAVVLPEPEPRSEHRQPTEKPKEKQKDRPKEKPDVQAVQQVEPAVAKAIRDQEVRASDIQSAKDLFDGLDASHVIDTANPKDENDFSALAELLASKITVYEKSIHYKSFLRSLLKSLAMPLKSDEVKDLAAVLGVVANEKLKSDKPAKKKKAAGPQIVKKGATAGKSPTAEADDEDLENDVRYTEHDAYDFM